MEYLIQLFKKDLLSNNPDQFFSFYPLHTLQYLNYKKNNISHIRVSNIFKDLILTFYHFILGNAYFKSKSKFYNLDNLIVQIKFIFYSCLTSEFCLLIKKKKQICIICVLLHQYITFSTIQKKLFTEKLDKYLLEKIISLIVYCFFFLLSLC